MCVQPVSSQLAGAVDASGALTATWTRRLAANATGVAPIAPGQAFHAIAAWGPKKDRQAAPCAAGWPEHTTTGSATLAF